jgi:RNA polymerase sigma factor (sigma-70 family)
MQNEEKILISIVEDDLIIGPSLRERINDSELFECKQYYTEPGIAIKGIRKENPDIVIMDIGLPVMNGVECMKSILKYCPEIRFVMFTVFDTDELLFDALRSGASGYILKDNSFEEIIEALEEVTMGGGPMSPAIAKKVIKSFNRTATNKKLEQLTEHQIEILKMIADGLYNKEIADHFNIREGTVKVQISTIYKKLQVNNRVEASNIYKDLN